MTTLTFSDAPIPASTGRGVPAGPNPFADVVKALVGADTAKKFSVPGANDEKTNEELRTALRQLRAAGADNDVSVRTSKEVTGTAKAPTVTVTFWTTPRIERKRKQAESAEPQPAGSPTQDDGGTGQPVDELATAS